MPTTSQKALIILSCIAVVLAFGYVSILLDAWLGYSSGWAREVISTVLSITGFIAMLKVGEKVEQKLTGKG